MYVYIYIYIDMVGLYFFACQLGCTSNIPGRATPLISHRCADLSSSSADLHSVVVCIFRFIHYPHTVSILYMMYLLVYSRIYSTSRVSLFMTFTTQFFTIQIALYSLISLNLKNERRNESLENYQR